MAVSSTGTVQLNVRVDAQVKHDAEEVLHLMGTTLTEFVRAMLAKVATGAKAYEHISDTLFGAEVAHPSLELPQPSEVLIERDAVIGRFYEIMGWSSPEDVPVDDRSWDEIYEEAMIAKGIERGWLQ